MRIVYGVFGYGRGHATRALSVLPELTRKHQVMVFAGGDAYDVLYEHYDAFRLPTMGYVYGPDGRHSLIGTLQQNTGPVIDAVFGGSAKTAVQRAVESFRPHVAVSDAEPWTHHVAARLGVPRVSFDHVGMLAHCRVPVPAPWRWAVARDASTYWLLMGRPQRAIVSSFFHAEPRRPGVHCVDTLLRAEVRGITASEGNHVLVYFNRGRHQLSRAIEQHLQRLGVPVVVYGSGRVGTRGNLTFRAPSNLGFLRDLASARAVVSTAGNQLVGECIHFEKPLLAVPENCLEQHINAAAVRRLEVGDCVEPRAFDAQVVERFLMARGRYLIAVRALKNVKRPDALGALEQCLFSLAPRSALTVPQRLRYA